MNISSTTAHKQPGPGQRFLELAIHKGNALGSTLIIFTKTMHCRSHIFRHYRVNGLDDDCLEAVAQAAIFRLEESIANYGMCPISDLRYRICRKPRDGSFYAFLLTYIK